MSYLPHSYHRSDTNLHLVLYIELLNIDIFPIYPYEFMLVLQLTINQFMLLPQILYIKLNSRKWLKGLKNIAL